MLLHLWNQNLFFWVTTYVHLSPCLSLSWLSRSSPYTRRLHSQSGNDITSSTPYLLHRSVMLLTSHLVFVGFPTCMCGCLAESQLVTVLQHCGCERCLCVSNGLCLYSSSSYGKRLDDPTMTSLSTGTSSAGLSRLNSVLAQRYLIFVYCTVSSFSSFN